MLLQAIKGATDEEYPDEEITAKTTIRDLQSLTSTLWKVIMVMKKERQANHENFINETK